MIQWRPDFATGIASVDHEHQELVAQVNAIVAALENAADATAVEAALADLHDAISAHFALEERIMRDHAYAGYRPHKDDHERLLDDIRDVMEDQRADPAGHLAPRLQTWFARHFATLDADLHRLLDVPHSHHPTRRTT